MMKLFLSKAMFQRVALPGLLISVAFGCNEKAEMPATFPATGKVVFKDGKPMSGGVVQFQAEKDEGITVVGETDDNGNFSLQTLKGNRKKDGAMQGTYRVIILPPQSDDHQIAPPIEIEERCTIAAKENVIATFRVDRPLPSRGTTP